MQYIVMILRHFLFLLILASFLSLNGCGNGGNDSPAQLISLSLSPTVPSIIIGNSVQLTAHGTYSDQQILDLTDHVQWATSDENLASVSTEAETIGLLTAHTQGEVTVTATLDNIVGSQVVTITLLTWTTFIAEENPPIAHSVCATNDGSFVITGRRLYNDQNWNVYAAKLDVAGRLVWQNNYGDTDERVGNSVVEIGDALVIAGQWMTSDSFSHLYLLGTDSNGTLLWEKTYGGPYNDVANAIQAVTDGNLIVVGSTQVASTAYVGAFEWDVQLLKTDTYGELIWDELIIDGIPASGISSVTANSIRQVTQGGFIIAGTVHNVDLFGNFYLLRIDEVGAPIWQKNFGDSWAYENGLDVQETPSGGFVVVGNIKTDMGAGAYGCYAFQTNADGELEWQRNYSTLTFDSTYAIVPATDGAGYCIAGTAYSYSTNSLDIWLFQIDLNGEIVWDRMYGDQADEIGVGLQQTMDGGYIVVANKSSGTSQSIQVLKTNGNGEIEGLSPNPY